MSESSQTKVMAPSVHRTAEARPARVFNGPRPDDARRAGSAAETCRIHLITPATGMPSARSISMRACRNRSRHDW